MKKRNILFALLSVLSLTSCDATMNDLDVGIRDDKIENSSVRLNIKYKDTWVNDDVVLRLRFGHQENSILKDNYYLSISDTNPIYNPNSINLTTIFSFTRAQLEPNTVTEKNFEYKYSTKEFHEVKFSNLESMFKKTEEKAEFYFVFHSSSTDFTNITQFTVSDFTYTFNGTKLSIKHD